MAIRLFCNCRCFSNLDVDRYEITGYFNFKVTQSPGIVLSVIGMKT